MAKRQGKKGGRKVKVVKKGGTPPTADEVKKISAGERKSERVDPAPVAARKNGTEEYLRAVGLAPNGGPMVRKSLITGVTTVYRSKEERDAATANVGQHMGSLSTRVGTYVECITHDGSRQWARVCAIRSRTTETKHKAIRRGRILGDKYEIDLEFEDAVLSRMELQGVGVADQKDGRKALVLGLINPLSEERPSLSAVVTPDVRLSAE